MIITKDHRRFLRNLFLLLLVGSTSVCSQTKKYGVNEAKDHVGEYATVIGIVMQVFQSQKGNTFLNMGGTYPNHEFTVVVFRKYRYTFASLSNYQGKEIEISGMIEEYRGKPEIIATSPSQITIVR